VAREHDDPWRRLREREDEQTGELSLRERRAGVTASESTSVKADMDSEKLAGLLESTRTLIDQLNNLYNMYFQGVEQRPPSEKRRLLDKTMEQLMNVPKPTAAALFRFHSLQSNYLTYKDRWDRMMRDLEAGKIRRG
jgi:hypothetical protein